MDLDKYIAEEMARFEGRCFPVKTGMIKRLLTKRQRCKNLHPNPDDEFSKPEVGPSYRIISEYEQKIRRAKEHTYEEEKDPIIIEKMYPEGYMIINGHHRWAAALRMGVPDIFVKIVNLTHEADLRLMLERSTHDKRVTFDLDEVVFGKEGEEALERGLSFPFSLEYKERLRIGIPALFNHLSVLGYDIWVYSSNFYSFDYLKQLFKRYHVKVDGVVTGIAKRSQEAKDKYNKLIAEKYKSTIHVDRNMVLKTYTGSKEFEEKEIPLSDLSWSHAVMDIVDEMEKDA
ncbi:ParB N-terminal domain-containing protein [Butyrivibrio hungatei]|uniref:ParB-like nuclease domain protein n=1 Tax=Butyrivibrio hungatei TaxID=185008 RepID=A0A1D9NYM6_9FIRM|nr:ParB N-terminal domain-containing protein [Butyrivibrio hungatei]AOZ95403.1 ParB-like nuclease domain protein [Butyrivibrio hungatei]